MLITFRTLDERIRDAQREIKPDYFLDDNGYFDEDAHTEALAAVADYIIDQEVDYLLGK